MKRDHLYPKQKVHLEAFVQALLKFRIGLQLEDKKSGNGTKYTVLHLNVGATEEDECAALFKLIFERLCEKLSLSQIFFNPLELTK